MVRSGGGDFQSRHIYFKKLFRPKPDQRAFIISEFGGYSLKVPGHLWEEDKKFGYRFYETKTALASRVYRTAGEGIDAIVTAGAGSRDIH